MEGTFIDPPPEAVASGIKGGFWIQIMGQGAKAIIYWRGGPMSPDKDIILFDVNAEIPGLGHGSFLVHEILAWCDQQGLTISCLVPQERAAWLARLGLVAVEQRYGEVVMGRPPVPVLSN